MLSGLDRDTSCAGTCRISQAVSDREKQTDADGQREREREGERRVGERGERERERQTDRQTDRQRQRDKESERESLFFLLCFKAKAHPGLYPVPDLNITEYASGCVRLPGICTHPWALRHAQPVGKQKRPLRAWPHVTDVLLRLCVISP